MCNFLEDKCRGLLDQGSPDEIDSKIILGRRQSNGTNLVLNKNDPTSRRSDFQGVEFVAPLPTVR